MSSKRRHRRSVSQFDGEHKKLIKGISVAAGLVVFAVVGAFLMVRGFMS